MSRSNIDKSFFVFVRCEFCVKKCKHRKEVNRTTGDIVDGCIVDERDVDKYTKGANNGER